MGCRQAESLDPLIQGELYTEAAAAAALPLQPRAHTGGAWKQFMHEQHSNRPQDVSLRYRALPPEEKSRLERDGHEATERGRAGLQPYSNARQVEAMRKQRMLQVVAREYGTVEHQDIVDRVIAETVAMNQGIDHAASQLRRLQLERSKASKAADREDMQILAAYQRENTTSTLQELPLAIPQVRETADSCVALPPILGATVLDQRMCDHIKHAHSVLGLLDNERDEGNFKAATDGQ